MKNSEQSPIHTNQKGDHPFSPDDLNFFFSILYPDGIIAVFDNDLRCVYFSGKELERIFKTNAKEIIGKHADEFSPGGHKRLIEYLREAQRGTLIEYETRFENSYYHIRIQATPVPNGYPGYITLIVHDITRNKRLESELNDSRQRYRHLMEHVSDGICLGDPDGNILMVNPALCHLLGYTEEELLELSAYNLISPESISKTPLVKIEQLSDQHTLSMQRSLRHKNGALVPVIVSVSLTVERLFHIVIRGNTPYQQAEDALRENQIFIQNVLNTSPLLVLIYDIAEKRISYATTRLNEILGYSDSLPGKDRDFLVSLFHPEDLPSPRIFDEFIAGIEMGKVVKFEARIKDASGNWIWFHLRATTLSQDESGKPRLALINGLDISDRKNMEETLRGAYQEVEKRLIESSLQIASTQNALQSEINQRRMAEDRSLQYAFNLRSLTRIASSFNTELDLQTVIHTLRKEIEDNFEVLPPVVTLYDRDKDVLTPAFLGEEESELLKAFPPISGSQFISLSAKLGTIFYFADLPAEKNLHEAEFFSSYSVRTLVSLALANKGRLIGTLNLFTRDEVRYFSREELSLLQAYASHAAIAIENASLYHEAQERVVALENLAQISAVLRAAKNRQQVATSLVKMAAEAFLTNISLTLRKIGDHLLVSAGYGEAENIVGQEISFSNAGADIRRIFEIYPVDYYHFENTPEVITCLSGFSNTIDWIGLPIKTAPMASAALLLGFPSRRELSRADSILLQALSEVINSSIQRAEAMEDLENRVVDRTTKLASLYEISSLITGELDLPAALQNALEQVLTAVNAKAGYVQMFDENHTHLDCIASLGLSMQQQESKKHQLPENCLENRAIEIKQVYRYNSDNMTLGNSQKPARCISLPIIRSQQALGVVTVVSADSGDISPVELSLVEAAANLIGAMLENARLRSQVARVAIAEERARLSRDLHDSVTQSLFSMSLFTETARKAIAGGETIQAIETLDAISETVRQALKEIRLLVYDLRPPVIEQEGLINALRQRLQLVENRSGVKTEIVVDDVFSLPIEIEQELYAIMQEALNNTLKHSSAHHIRVWIHQVDEFLEFLIEDDGHGFDVQNEKDPRGIGLDTMRERANHLRADLNIQSLSGKGTTVTIRMRIRPVSPLQTRVKSKEVSTRSHKPFSGFLSIFKKGIDNDRKN